MNAVGKPEGEIRRELKRHAFERFAAKTDRRDGYARLYVFEAYQGAALDMLRKRGGDLGTRASICLEYCLEAGERSESVPERFPSPEVAIGAETFITKLVERPELREKLWPEPRGNDFKRSLLEIEQRRELLSGMCRLGASYVDLYLTAIERIGTFELRGQADSGDEGAEQLAGAFVEVLARQAQTPGFHAFRELSDAAAAFDTVIATNFPEVRGAKVPMLRTIYGRTLQGQGPVATTTTGKVHRLVRQFRMPGYPLVLVSTDILQEGEDLHTFCRKVVHYGITWTPSAMEQRTGRVDRIGSLTQRNLDGRAQAVRPDEKIQVYFPHLRDTVEVLQVRKVLSRLNRFLTMMHNVGPAEVQGDSRVDAMREMIADSADVPAITTRLESAFPVREEWLKGEAQGTAATEVEIEKFRDHWGRAWRHVVEKLGVVDPAQRAEFHSHGVVLLKGGRVAPRDQKARQQPFTLELRAEDAGNETLLRCVSPVGLVDLGRSRTAFLLEELQRKLSMVKVCAEWDAKRREYDVTVVREMLFHPDTTQLSEVDHLVWSAVHAADELEKALHHEDAEPALWFENPEVAG